MVIKDEKGHRKGLQRPLKHILGNNKPFLKFSPNGCMGGGRTDDKLKSETRFKTFWNAVYYMHEKCNL